MAFINNLLFNLFEWFGRKTTNDLKLFMAEGHDVNVSTLSFSQLQRLVYRGRTFIFTVRYYKNFVHLTLLN
jgi:hypothetical protein